MVLVVDDDPQLRRMVARMLDIAGFRAVQAANGAEAVAVATVDPPDLLLTDVMMPDTDPLVVVEHLRTRQTSLPVVYMSATNPSLLRTEYGIDPAQVPLLAKPFRMAQLLEMIERVLAGTWQPSVAAGWLGHV